MDPLTHALTGALVADALPFTKRLGYKAPLAATIAGMAPDLDMVPAFLANFPPKSFSFSGLFNVDLVIRLHRTYSHSFFCMAVAAIPLAYAAWRLSDRKGTWRQWGVMIALALFSHSILDISNPWGAQVLLPFSRARPTFSDLPLMDPFVLGVTGSVFILNHVLRDSYPDAALAGRRRYAWRTRTAAWLDARVGATTLGAIGATLVMVRLVLAWLA